jgi:hypothetical protein
MGIQKYVVYYSTNAADYYALDNVQNIVINLGKRAQLEQVRASTMSFSMRFPNGYASPIAGLVPGSYIRIYNETGSQYGVWFGKIADVTAVYGIPYSGNVGQSDYLDVSCEGNFAVGGRLQGNNYAMAAGTITSQFANATTQSGNEFNYLGSTQSLAATTVSGTWGDWIGRVCQSTNARVWDGRTSLRTNVISPFYIASSPNDVNFSDVANNNKNQVYNQINFHSLADNFYTQVTVSPESSGAVTVTQSGATKPYRTYQTNTINFDTTQATDYANYLLGNYGTPQVAIASIVCMAEAQANFQLDKIGMLRDFASSPGHRVSVTFRGTTYNCVMEGATMSATPAGATFTYYVSSADLNNFLLLNNTVFGTLDNNRLGY